MGFGYINGILDLCIVSPVVAVAVEQKLDAFQSYTKPFCQSRCYGINFLPFGSSHRIRNGFVGQGPLEAEEGSGG